MSTVAKKARRSADPFARSIEDALELGRSIPYDEAWGFVSSPEGVANRIDRLRSAEPARAVAHCEMLPGGLSDKAEDIDDSDVHRDHRRKHGFMPAFERIAQSAC